MNHEQENSELRSRSSASGTPRWRVLEASVIGTSHKRMQQPYQDSHYLEVQPDGSLILAVADGAGSASHSQIGSEVAARTAVKSILGTSAAQPIDWGRRLSEAVISAKRAVEERAAQEKVPVHQFFLK